ncbi:GAF domain-containing protein [Marinibaculum pumilum]|uniref:GAF domain-containing protein n=1 Tax=Marinibaculum pumilum TaxID=1766165 RepID=A0ABV7L868_9PROT
MYGKQVRREQRSMVECGTDSESARLEALERYGILDTEPEQAYDEVTAIAAGICETPIAIVSLVDRDRQWFKSCVGLEVRETPRDVAFCHHAIQRPGILEVEDALEDPRFRSNPLVTGAPGIRYYAGAPLETPDGHRLGTLCVIDRQPRRISLPQRRALEALARQVVSQLELRSAFRTTELMRRRLEKEVARRTALEQQYRRAEGFLRETGDALPDHIAILDREGVILQVNRAWMRFARRNAPPSALPRLGPGANYLQVCDAGSARGCMEAAEVAGAIRAALQGTIEAGWNLEYPCHSDRRKRWYIARVAGFSEGSKAYAVISHHDITQRRQAEEELWALNRNLEDRVAARTGELSQANSQLRESEAQLRALAARLRRIREEERKLISREIHDELGQLLTVLKIDLAVLRSDLLADGDGPPPDQVAAELEGMAGLVGDTLQSVKRIAKTLRPEVLDSIGLESALQLQASEFRSRSGTVCDIRIDADLSQLDEDVRTALFRITQEALTNVARHAQANRVEIRIARDKGSLVLSVRDDGVGFARLDTAPTSLGILGMRERAADIGARLDLQGAPGNGTAVVVTLPTAQP